MSDQCDSVIAKNKQNWIRSKEVLFLETQLSNKTFFFQLRK